MKFVLPFTGSRGDIQPGLALGIELAERGHEVVFGAPPNLMAFASAVTGGRVTIVAFGPDTKALLESELVRTRIKSRNPRVRFAALAELANFGWDRMVAELTEMSTDADAIVTGTLGQEMAFNMAEAQGIPFLALHYCPLRRNGSMSVSPNHRLPALVNRTTWSLLETVRWRSMRLRENAQRTSLGLPGATHPLPKRIEQYGGIEIQAYDGNLFPGLRAEWGTARPFVGFLELPPVHPPLGADLGAGSPLREWIDSGDAPLYFGFGSMPVRDPEALIESITEACAATGHRALVSSGWSAIPERLNAGSRVAIVGPVDHGSVFPLCRAVIHHGGAGTTAAGIRAGRPTMVCWFSADQPFWGTAVTRVGAGLSTQFARLDGPTLTEALGTLLSDETSYRAQQLAATTTHPHDAVRAAADLAERAVTRTVS
ncbi:glycosyltransferase [Rhodococcoides yunnanense]|uniref:glycosyltransferase n=1 Tax=Rhodococcoides yunnanense TaxID=278209 RepID=UPI000933D623|nr:glycosyltransferase [Rhodococcus yunnanensis]